ncbi:hypothetical protein XPA_004600 [Xanthoria parietina]
MKSFAGSTCKVEWRGRRGIKWLGQSELYDNDTASEQDGQDKDNVDLALAAKQGGTTLKGNCPARCDGGKLIVMSRGWLLTNANDSFHQRNRMCGKSENEEVVVADRQVVDE